MCRSSPASLPIPPDAIQATFYSGDWSGQLRAYVVNATTGLANLNSTIPVLFNSSSTTRLANIFTSTGATASGALYTSVSSNSNLNSYLAGGSPLAGVVGAVTNPIRPRWVTSSTPRQHRSVRRPLPVLRWGQMTACCMCLAALPAITPSFSYIPRAVTAANLTLLGSTTYGGGNHTCILSTAT
jgi:type IV pilus assembly protein PilY1